MEEHGMPWLETLINRVVNGVTNKIWLKSTRASLSFKAVLSSQRLLDDFGYQKKATLDSRCAILQEFTLIRLGNDVRT